MEIAEDRVERAARVIFAQTHEGGYSPCWDRVNPSQRLRCLRAARAVLSDVEEGLI